MTTIGDQQIPTRLVDSAIAPFVKAMQMAGINLSFDQVKAGLVVRQVNGANGKTFRIIVTSNTQDQLADDVPLLLGEQRGGLWQWRSSGLDALSEMIGIPFGINLWYKDNTGTVIRDQRYDNIIRKDFSLATVGAGVGWQWLEPSPGHFDRWSLSDMTGQLQQAKSFNNLKTLRLHAVLWAQQYPDWLNELSGTDAAKAILARVEFLANRYKGIVQEVVVVNEPYYSGPLFTGSGNFTRADVLYQKLGPNYLVTAFAKARELFGPRVKLIYNDTANHSLIYGPNGGYTQATQRNVTLLAQQGLVDYVGMQMHIDAEYPPSENEIIQAIQSYGIPVVITELDVRLDNLPATVSEVDKQKIQAQIYSQTIQAAVKSGKVKEISIGEAGDKYSWFVEWMNSPNAEATVFDNNFNPKISYYSVLKALLAAIRVSQ